MKQLSRREVIKTFAFGAAFSSLAGSSWARTIAFGIKPLAAQNRTGLLVVRFADFPELNQALGSVRLATSPLVPATSGGQKHSGLFPPILINRGEAGELYVMGADCTHEGCTVRELNPTTKLVNCSCLPPVHGSQFRIDGAVARGPARQSLQKYDFVETEESVEIEMPNSFYNMKAEGVDASGRFRISFLALEETIYEVYFRTTLDAPAQKVSFATTPDGALDQTEIAGPPDGAFLNLYMDRSAPFGFYQLAMKTMVV